MDFKEALSEQLKLIDECFEANEIPVSQRTSLAAFIFVQECIVSVDGDNKSNFTSKPWFAIIYHHVKEWYEEHYGPTTSSEPSCALGVVLVRGIPIKMQVPLTRSEVETPGETAWLHFPVEIDDEEDPQLWLVNPPPLDKLTSSQLKKLDKKIKDVGTRLRCIRMNLMGIEPSDETVNGFLNGVLTEFESAANNILRQDVSGRGSALWSLQMGVEKILKAFAQHKTGTYQHSHNLFSLYDDVKEHGISAQRTLLNKMPRSEQVISGRYGHGSITSITEVIDVYNAALEFASEASNSFHRGINIGGASFLLKKPSWLELPPPEEKKKCVAK